MSIRTRSNIRGRGALAALGALLVLVPAMLSGCGSNGGAATSKPVVDVTGASDSWNFHDGQTVKVSMGTNSLFKQFSRVNILQCADPGGKSSNLPTKFIECDENTVEGNTVVVQKGGAFSEPSYTVYKLPSETFGEPKDSVPICDSTHACVLMVSEFQTDFTKPKAFSHPFTVTTSDNGSGGTP